MSARRTARERLLEDTWSERARTTRRQLLVELGAAAAFLIVAAGLAFGTPNGDRDAGLIIGLVVGYALLSRVEFPIGRAYMVPTQLALVPMLFAVSPGIVPLLVAAGLLLGAVADWLSRRGPAERMLFSISDAWHAIGPAAVFVAAGDVRLELGELGIFAAAFAAQCALDAVSNALRERLAFGTPPQLQLQVLGQAVLLDALLCPIGVLAAYAGRDEPLLLLLAAPVGVLLLILARDRSVRIGQAQERLEAVRRERVRLQRAIKRIGEAFAPTLDFDALLELTLLTSAEAIDADGGRTSVLRAGRLGVVARATVGEHESLAAALDAAEGQVLLFGEPAERTEGDVSALAWPIGGRGDAAERRAGVVALARRGAPFNVFERSLLDYFVQQANVSVENIELRETLRQQAGTDSLTGLANRRAFEDQLSASIAHHHETRTPLALVMFDIDNFKHVNDTHGHPAGDEVLRACARALRGTCRAGDAPARYGGEELAVILLGVEEREAADFAERLRAGLEATSIPLPHGELTVTASFGVACMRGGGRLDDAADLLKAADRALYAAKHAGKNRVVLADDVITRQQLEGLEPDPALEH